jgi:ribosomal protein L37AE/L43A
MINYKYKCMSCGHKQKKRNKDHKCWCCNKINTMEELVEENTNGTTKIP